MVHLFNFSLAVSKIEKNKRKNDDGGDIVITMDKTKQKPVTRRVKSAIKKMYHTPLFLSHYITYSICFFRLLFRQLKKLVQSFCLLCVILGFCYWLFKWIVFDYSSEKVGSDENLAYLLQNLEKI